MNLTALVGSGHRIALFAVPFVIIGVLLTSLHPSLFVISSPPSALKPLSGIILALGVVVWAWSVVLILTNVPHHRLIETGPYAIVKHPLYTNLAFLVAPWLGFLFNSWWGVLVGVALYLGSRLFARDEERTLSREFGATWDQYRTRVMLPWL
jgi:protein-S-isoprenylcysteine O-methyltransferase Ste14